MLSPWAPGFSTWLGNYDSAARPKKERKERDRHFKTHSTKERSKVRVIRQTDSQSGMKAEKKERDRETQRVAPRERLKMTQCP